MVYATGCNNFKMDQLVIKEIYYKKIVKNLKHPEGCFSYGEIKEANEING